ncbi:MAG: hypothetical protein M1829_000738 [Trizodia sp. TS-e1964]|nr:MAG: hypothetical protein M1829_000738 [Trizodia sp. TS-e1964]
MPSPPEDPAAPEAARPRATLHRKKTMAGTSRSNIPSATAASSSFSSSSSSLPFPAKSRLPDAAASSIPKPRSLAPSPLPNSNSAPFKISPDARARKTPASAASEASSAGSRAGPRRNVLRRKPSSISRRSASGLRSGSTTSAFESDPSVATSASMSLPGGYTDPFPGSILGITLPPPGAGGGEPAASSTAYRNRQPATSALLPDTSTEFVLRSAAQDSAPSASVFAGSSPSTRHSESPGPWSRGSTPTSMSSHSPGILPSTKLASRQTKGSQAAGRPMNARLRASSASREAHLGVIRESLTSSSSGSTIKAGERPGKALAEGKKKSKKTTRLSPPPESPMPSASPLKGANPSASRALTSHKKPLHPNASLSPPPASPLHLSSTSSLVLGMRPARPSRDGAPEFDAYSESTPVIQSNIAGFQAPIHRRRRSSDANVPPTPLVGSSSQKTPLKQKHFRLPSPSPAQPQQGNHHKTSQTHLLTPSADSALAERSRDLKRAVNPALTSPSKLSSRFGIFSRRPKPAADAPVAEKPEKTLRKGPAAGTGHEGYGKYAMRGRSGSSTSTSGSWVRSTSASSATGSAARSTSSRKGSVASRGDSDIDDFLLERLGPVVITGGGGILGAPKVSFDMLPSSSGQALAQERPSLDSKASSSYTSSKPKLSHELSRGSPRPALAALSLPRSSSDVSVGSNQRPPLQRHDSESSSLRAPTLAARRSLNKSQLFVEKEPLRILTPSDTSFQALSSTTSNDTNLYSAIPPSDSSIHQLETAPAQSKSKLKNPKKPEKQSKLGRKWNFFQRAHAATGKTAAPSNVPATVVRHAPLRSVAHYALPDASEFFEDENFEDIMQEFVESPVSDDDRLLSHTDSYILHMRRQSQHHSILLPDPPTLPSSIQNSRPSSPRVMLRPSEDVSSPPDASRDLIPAKRSRLAQVGRIPRVVSTKRRDAVSQSFSRPRPEKAQQATVQTRPVEPLNYDLFAGYTMGPPSTPRSVAPTTAPAAPPEFLTFPPRKGSELSCSSSSGTISFAATTAVIPKADAALSEDEIWNEYDELIDNVLSPTAPPPTTARPPAWRLPPQPSLARGSKTSKKPLQQADGLIRRTSLTLPTRSPVEKPNLSTTSNLLPAPTSATLPATPLSFTEFFAGYGERNKSASVLDPFTARLSTSTRSRLSARSGHSRSASDQASGVPKPYFRDTQLVNYAEREQNGLGSQMNVRFGALMTSRWLSFGRVLFSPAHDEIKQSNSMAKKDRVLVLDGLGNDDWSFYCALTYPNATVYNLSPSPSTSLGSSERRESGSLQSPPNHRQIHHPSIADPFPFPKGFFSAIVLRFPTANSEAAYRNAISESKRVLRPGGYLEMGILDLDMMNMGNRARHAVRMLKIRMQVADNSISLKPTSDTIQRLLGRRGFENLNRCTVGVPVAGVLLGSRNGLAEQKDRSLTDMLKDDSSEGDEGITMMVARVGRWWYTRCFEMGILPNGDLSRSIWNDNALLAECETRKTSFRLLICYAQKPLAPLRRTVSV